MHRATRLIADPYAPYSLGARARARRQQALLARFPALADMRVLDLGGDLRYWELGRVRPQQLTALNLYPQGSPGPGARTLVGDACDPPASLRDERFDLVFSNSVIEHVGGHARRRAFAEQVHRLGSHHWIQTPNLWFPLEPHWLFPGFQYLPLRAKQEVTLRWPLGHMQPEDARDALERSLEIELLSKRTLQHYFPDSQLEVERVLGLPKSLIAVR